MIYTGKTKKLAVIGYPIEHSLSPVMQNAALQALDLDYLYMGLSIAPENLGSCVEAMKNMGFTGFNVTIPHKVAIMEHLDYIDPAAKAIGAVNTVHIQNGKLAGYNTDGVGFIRPLLATGIDLKGATVVICGAGGACRAVIYALFSAGVEQVVLQVRNPEKAQPLAKQFAHLGKIVILDQEEGARASYWSEAKVVINSTPLGMKPHYLGMTPPVPWEKVNPQAIAYDLIYTPRETAFLREAKANNHKIINGEAMLAGQGAEALHYWTGAEIPVDIMVQALREFLDKAEV